MNAENLSGYTVCRNVFKLDYPVNLTIRSLLNVCAEVVACDSDSDDGTSTMLQRWAAKEPRLKVINFPWRNPVNDSKWFTDWLNFTREHLSLPMQLQLDADEVLDDSALCLSSVINSARDGSCMQFDRLNFWRDPKSLIPDGHCCAKFVTRMGPSNLWMPSDEPHPEGAPEIVAKSFFHQDLRIFHLGFLRHPAAFYRKSRVVQGAFFGAYDERLVEAEEKSLPQWESRSDFINDLIPYAGTHPHGVKEWLNNRGHAI